MRRTVIQSNLTVGELSPDMFARIDNNMYYAGVAKAQNVVIMPHGGLRRRPGLTATTDTLLGSVNNDGKLFAFEFSSTQDYVVYLSPNQFRIFKDGVKVFDDYGTSPYATVTECKEVDVTQSGDIMVITHPNYRPRLLQRLGADNSWDMIEMPLYNIPKYDYGDRYPDVTISDDTLTVNYQIGALIYWTVGNGALAKEDGLYSALVAYSGDPKLEDYNDVARYTDLGPKSEDVWSDARGWPITCTFFQSRLWLAGSPSKPNSIWASKINGFFDFDVGDGQADFGIFDTLDTEQYNQIRNIYPGRNLMVFTSGSEFYQTASVVTPETSVWKRSTGYGSKRMRPTMVDGAVLFADKLGRTVRSAVYAFQEDAFVAPSISIPSEHLIKNVVAMDSIKGSNIDVSDFVYIINADGTMAVLNTIRHEGTEGWTEWTTFSSNENGGFRDVVVVNNVVYFAIEREGSVYLEYLNEGTTTDHNNFATALKPDLTNVDANSYNIVHGGSNAVHTDPNSGTPIATLNTGFLQNMENSRIVVIADGSIMEDANGTEGTVYFDRPVWDAEVGLDVPLKVISMPMNVPVKDGATVSDRKRIVKTLLTLRDTLGLYANMTYAPDRTFKVVMDEAPEPFSGLKELYLLGYTRTTQLEIYQDHPLPFKLLGLGWEIDIGDN